MKRFLDIRNSLSFWLIFWVGLILLVSISTWAYFNIRYQKRRATERVAKDADRLGNTIKLGTHYAMMLNSRDDINQIISNISRQKEIENVRIYNKKGQSTFSNRAEEVGQVTNIKAEACYICHEQDPPLETVSLAKRTRMLDLPGGSRILGIITPINNEPGCSGNSCHVHPQGKKVQVNEALDKALEIFSQQLKLREIEVVKELQEDLPPILADSSRLEQVFINLLTNARDAIEEKWEDADRADHMAEGKKIFLATSSKDRSVIIEVKDTGEGIPKSVLDKVFDPFFTTKKVGKGTGLGLSISYGIIKDYGGTVKVESQEGKGSDFVIQFPAASEA